MPRFKLNPVIPGNYSFHCPDERITLNVYRPAATFKEVTPAIVRGVTTNRIIDIDGVVEVKHHHIETIQPIKEASSNGVQDKEKENKQKEEIIAEPQAEEVVEVAKVKMVEEKTTEEVAEEQPAEPKPKTSKKRSSSAKK